MLKEEVIRMMKGLKIAIASVLCSAVLFGCSNMSTEEQVGIVGGAVAGGAIGNALGHNAASTVAGAAVGGLAGGAIGNNMSNQ